jgi:hypothetical protein
MSEQVGNPFFGKKGTKAYAEACESMNTEEHVKRMNELHHTDYVIPKYHKPRRTKVSKWTK